MEVSHVAGSPRTMGDGSNGRERFAVVKLCEVWLHGLGHLFVGYHVRGEDAEKRTLELQTPESL